jgi:hypothetical protein
VLCPLFSLPIPEEGLTSDRSVAGIGSTIPCDWPLEPNSSSMRQTSGTKATSGNSGGVSVWFRRGTTCFVIGAASVAIPVSTAAAGTPAQRARSYSLPSDRWKPGQSAMEAISSAPFHAALTRLGACTPNGSVSYLWPAGFRVRFHPTVLLDPAGRVVAHQGQYFTVGGGIVGTASWPSAERCYKGGSVFAIQSSIQVGRPGVIPPGYPSSH